MGTQSEYSVTVRLIRLQHPYNIWCAVRLIDGYTQRIFSHCPADPTATPIQYWMCCWADQWVHRINIQSVSGSSDCNTQIILDMVSGWSIDTPREYWVTVRLIRLKHLDNIPYAISLTDTYTYPIFRQCPANRPMLLQIFNHHYLLLFGEHVHSVNWILYRWWLNEMNPMRSSRLIRFNRILNIRSRNAWPCLTNHRIR